MIARSTSFANVHVPLWAWLAALAAAFALLMLDLLVLHRRPKAPSMRRAAIETAGWALAGVSFGLVVLVGFGSRAGSEWFSGWLIEYSLSIDNVFVWALILTFFRVPLRYQHRVLFWGVFGALVLRAAFIFAGVALVRRFEVTMIVFGAFLLYTAGKLITGHDDEADPTEGRFYRAITRVVRTAPDLDGQKMFTRVDGRRVATPLFAVLLLIEATDVLFAVDSVPAVLGVSKTSFIVFTSNAFAIMGLRSLYFLLADMHARFSALQQGLAVILAFVGVKMIISRWYDIATPVSLLVIAIVLTTSISFSIQEDRRQARHTQPEPLPPPDER